MLRKSLIFIFLLVTAVLLAGTASAATSVAWTSPANNSVFTVGTIVNPIGAASATGVAGTGLDLALVLDSSGSMRLPQTVGAVTQSRGQWQKDAANALVNSLPTTGVSVAVIEFDSFTSTPRVLSPLGTQKAQVIAAINGVDELGGTNIALGIAQAQGELTSVRHTAGRDRAMVVFSDGLTSPNPEQSADNAIVAGINNIHSVGLPGHVPLTMQSIVDGVDDTFGNADDHGEYIDAGTAQGIQDLIDLFSGVGGSFVDIDRVEITLPNSTLLKSADGDFTVDAFGNFTVPGPFWAMQLGTNVFSATAWGTDGTSATASLTLIGTDKVNGVPEPATFLLLGLGLFGLAGFGRRKIKK